MVERWEADEDEVNPFVVTVPSESLISSKCRLNLT